MCSELRKQLIPFTAQTLNLRLNIDENTGVIGVYKSRAIYISGGRRFSVGVRVNQPVKPQVKPLTTCGHLGEMS